MPRKTSVVFNLFILSLVSCSGNLGNDSTYYKVIQKDVYHYYSSKVEKYTVKQSNIKITRSFIFVNGAITFDIDLKQKQDLYTGDSLNLKYDSDDSEDLCIYFPSRPSVILVWYKHNVYTIDWFLNKENGKDVYSREDFLRIKEMYENDQNDFSFLNKEYNEPQNE